jgi:hypothetical protein
MSVVCNANANNYLLGALISGRPITIMAWAKPDDVASPDLVVEVSRSGAWPQNAFFVRLVDSELVDVYDFLGNAQALTSYPNEWTVSEWNHLCIMSASHTDRSLWVNGAKTANALNCGSSTDSMTRIVVGKSLFNPSSPMPFDGKIAHVAVWDMVLSDDNIASLVAKARPDDIEPDHLLGYWPLINVPTAFVGDDLTEYGTVSYDAGDDPLLEWYAPMYGFGVLEPVLTCLTMAPAWQSWTWPVTETLLFDTEILQSHDRTEQRIARRRKVPGQSYQTKLVVWCDAGVAALESTAHHWLKRPWPVPVWTEAAQLGAALPAGSGAVTVDTRYASYRAGGYAVIQRRGAREILRIDSVADDSITLSAGTEQAWSASDWIMPLRQGRIVSSAVEERWPGGALVQIQVRVVDAEAVTGFTADQTYGGLAVLTTPSYWPGGAGESQHDPDVAVLESESGPFEIVSNSDYNESRQVHCWQCATAAAVWRLRQFLHAIGGRQKAFLVPTFRRDLVLSRAAGSSDTQIYVAAGPFASSLGGNTMRDHVAVRSGGSLIIREVDSIETVSAAEELLGLDAALGVGLAAGESLSWVDRCRLAADTVTFDWQFRRLMTCTATLTRVQ